MVHKVLLVLGVILVLVGFIGFFNNPVVGVFDVDISHNLIHIITGVLLLWFGKSPITFATTGARTFGIVYLLIAIAGYLTSGPILGLIEANTADDILHLVLGLILLYLGFLYKEKEVMSPAATAETFADSRPAQFDSRQ